MGRLLLVMVMMVVICLSQPRAFAGQSTDDQCFALSQAYKSAAELRDMNDTPSHVQELIRRGSVTFAPLSREEASSIVHNVYGSELTPAEIAARVMSGCQSGVGQ